MIGKYEIEIALEDFVEIVPAEDADNLKVGDDIENVNENCVHYGSKGKVVAMLKLPNEMGNIVAYECKNCGENFKEGDILLKTESQLKKMIK